MSSEVYMALPAEEGVAGESRLPACALQMSARGGKTVSNIRIILLIDESFQAALSKLESYSFTGAIGDAIRISADLI